MLNMTLSLPHLTDKLFENRAGEKKGAKAVLTDPQRL